MQIYDLCVFFMCVKCRYFLHSKLRRAPIGDGMFANAFFKQHFWNANSESSHVSVRIFTMRILLAGVCKFGRLILEHTFVVVVFNKLSLSGFCFLLGRDEP